MANLKEAIIMWYFYVLHKSLSSVTDRKCINLVTSYFDNSLTDPSNFNILLKILKDPVYSRILIMDLCKTQTIKLPALQFYWICNRVEYPSYLNRNQGKDVTPLENFITNFKKSMNFTEESGFICMPINRMLPFGNLEQNPENGNTIIVSNDPTNNNSYKFTILNKYRHIRINLEDDETIIKNDSQEYKLSSLVNCDWTLKLTSTNNIVIKIGSLTVELPMCLDKADSVGALIFMNMLRCANINGGLDVSDIEVDRVGHVTSDNCSDDLYVACINAFNRSVNGDVSKFYSQYENLFVVLNQDLTFGKRSNLDGSCLSNLDNSNNKGYQYPSYGNLLKSAISGYYYTDY